MAENDGSVFRALADPTRRQILQDLQGGELAAGEIAARFPISGPSVSRHLALLKAAGLVQERRDANRIYYSVVPERLATTVGGFLSAVCPEQMVLRHRRAERGSSERGSSERGSSERGSSERGSSERGSKKDRAR